MRTLVRLAIVGLLASPSIARAHEHGDAAPAADANAFTASILAEAAQFDTMDYGGDYEGTSLQLGWSHGRFGATAGIGLYRLQENGREVFGIGDTAVSGTAVLVNADRFLLGTSVMVMAPTGAMADGLGMGHVMGMAVLHGAVRERWFALNSSVGFSRALGLATVHHNHGAWPLVDPMNMSELVWSAGGDIVLARRAILAGPHVWGGVPVGEAGVTRVEAGVRVAWIQGRVTTGIDLQAGIVGDPYIVRGILATSMSF